MYYNYQQLQTKGSINNYVGGGTSISCFREPEGSDGPISIKHKFVHMGHGTIELHLGMQNSVFFDISLCRPLKVSQPHRGSCRFHLQS
jgi:hypothetical protein